MLKFKQEGYHRDGSMCVYGKDENGVSVVIFKGYEDIKNRMVTLYPTVRLAPTSENAGKQRVPLHLIK